MILIILGRLTKVRFNYCMNTDKLPKMRKQINTENLTLKCDPEMKAQLDALKYHNKVNVAEWLRQIIRRELEAISLAG